MKKYLILAIIVIIAITTISYIYLNNISSSNTVLANNKPYETLLNKTITGTEFATYINQIIDQK